MVKANPVIPVPRDRDLIVQSLLVILFVASLLAFIAVYKQHDAIALALKQIDSQELRLSQTEQQLKQYRHVRNRLFACGTVNPRPVWQHLSLSFINPSFYDLLDKLQKVGGDGMNTESGKLFVLSSMSLAIGDSTQGEEKESAAEFTLQGFILDLCSGEQMWKENI